MGVTVLQDLFQLVLQDAFGIGYIILWNVQWYWFLVKFCSILMFIEEGQLKILKCVSTFKVIFKQV
jgi:hypothetical protein